MARSANGVSGTSLVLSVPRPAGFLVCVRVLHALQATTTYDGVMA